MIHSEIIYAFLAVVLFLVQNWIGSRSYDVGYIKFSFLDEKDEALSLNFMLKVIGPTVFLILIAATIQSLSLPIDTSRLVHSVIWYLVLRIAVIFIFQRARIVNWPRLILHYISILVLAIVIQNQFISSVDTLLPDWCEIKNEIWLLIIFFLYEIGNGATHPRRMEGETQTAYLPELLPRKRRYVLRMYKDLQHRYEGIITQAVDSDAELEVVVYAVLVFENFNRPPAIRWIERLWLKLTRRQGTSGIMQVRSAHPLTDTESIRLGCQSMREEYLTVRKEEYDPHVFAQTIKHHSPDRKYIRQVLFIAKALIEHAYPKSTRKSTFKKLYGEISEEFGLYALRF